MGDLVVLDSQTQVKPKHAGGRPTLYSEAVAEAICDRILKGVRPEAAAVAQGLNADTFYAWMQERVEFSEAVARADAQAEDYYTESFHKGAHSVAGSVDWRAAESWLKRRRRAYYGDTMDITKLDVNTLRQWYEASVEQTAPAADPSLLTEEDVL